MYAHALEHMPVGVFAPYATDTDRQAHKKEDTAMSSTIDTFMLLTVFLTSNN
jgi:hypothetical protein